RKNEVLFSEEVAVLKKEVACKDYEINALKSEFEKVKQEKEGIEFKIEKFDKASKDQDQFSRSSFNENSQSTVRRPFQSKTILSNKRFTHKVNTANAQAVNTARAKVVNTARPKAVNTSSPHSAVVNAIRVNQQMR
ncbi:hypothetical protein Tco_1307448, partial [Tanacetum coccineum]